MDPPYVVLEECFVVTRFSISKQGFQGYKVFHFKTALVPRFQGQLPDCSTGVVPFLTFQDVFQLVGSTKSQMYW